MSILFGFGLFSQAHAAEFPVSGSYLFVRDNGKPVEESVSFSAPVAGSYYQLRIYNGPGDDDPVTSARVLVNGNELLFPSAFQQKTEFLEVSVTLQLQNTLTVQLGGKPGSALGAEVIGIDNDNPTISAAVSPEANPAGWHKTDATVTFTCDDALSGVENCSEPILVSGEGADQQITGSAVDKAGNSAETQVTVSLDKTPPQLTDQITPAANEAGWHRELVTVSYQCEDSLSGVTACPEPQQVAQEGESQTRDASIVDIAGNATEIQSLVNLDLTAPEITASVSPQANAAGWHNAPITVSYQCSDNLSGITNCPEAQTYSGDGEGQSVSGSTEDLAGNSASVETSFSLDRTPPEISFISPANGALLRERQPQLKLLLSDNLALDNDSLAVSVAGNSITGCTINANIAVCALPQPLSTDAEISLDASVQDLAGNLGDAGIATAIDSDGDSVADYADLCADTASTQTANSDGCALEQLDSDNDGVNDAEEVAEGTDPEDSTSFPPITIETFAASPTNISSKGQQVELRWRVSGAQELEISGDTGDEPQTDLESEGALVLNPQITTNYTLKATGPGGTTSETLAITLDMPPPPDLWTTPTVPVEEKIATSLAVADDGSAYVGAFDGNFYKVNASGEVEWTFEDAGLVMGKAAITGNLVIAGANISGSGRQAEGGRVFALKADKTPVWHFDTEGAVVAAPILSEDKTTAYISTYTGHIYALDVQTGSQLWHFQLPEEQKITAAPALAQQKLVVHTEDKQVFALNTESNPAGERLVWHSALGQ
ncbi:PQQ-binding-like beta-propeller repeat protein [Microbulbifer halophilus]|uniref:PQQ-binding-like beta-propeller repeat protein n=2 Tax=Microbulbifer halophilus TaxID=453963 RepID=A0ABW5EEY0_9GAMM|nr:PQQ-binding-like beta-propeller repeat protein [Microbulbifer halophilus]MCW8126235.1 PQQ-binding-like beta-propeller repeat protein [Microbulbifer halophilus]